MCLFWEGLRKEEATVYVAFSFSIAVVTRRYTINRVAKSFNIRNLQIRLSFNDRRGVTNLFTYVGLNLGDFPLDDPSGL